MNIKHTHATSSVTLAGYRPGFVFMRDGVVLMLTDDRLDPPGRGDAFDVICVDLRSGATIHISTKELVEPLLEAVMLTGGVSPF